jgi:hypothetical protein
MENTLKDPTLSYWCEQIAAYDKAARPWVERSRKIVKRYKDDRGEGERKKARFNILWSNVQTLHPAIYASPPKPNVDRRYQDDDELGTLAAQTLERSASYFVQEDNFDDIMNQCVLDRLLPGRMTAWVRYVPNFVDAAVQGGEEVQGEGVQTTDDALTGDEAPPQELASESVVIDYVHWEDFGHNVARTWQEVRAVWRKVAMSRKEIKERFGDDVAQAVPMDGKEAGKDSDAEDKAQFTKATIYELWDRVTKKAYWLHKDMDKFLDVRDDPLRLSGFYPCPRPVYSTVANDSLIPTPDFLLYQDQAIELDTLTARIDALTKALKVVGVYDASAEGLERMLSENTDNKLIPVKSWAMLAEKGGLKSVVDFFPLDMVVMTLTQLYAARESVKQSIYEITGISDIVRGSTNASETATAQQIKGQFATLRLDNMQKEVARFSRDLVRIITEIVAEHFSLETMKKISGIKLLSEQEKQMYALQAQAAQQAQMGQQMQAPPPQMPEEVAELMGKPAWEQVEGLIRDDALRSFRIDIETDSTIKADQEAEKAARVEFLTAAGSFMQQAVQLPPEAQPLAMQMLMFGVRGFKVGREMESEFRTALDKLRKRLENPQPPQPDPEIELKGKELGLKEQEMQSSAALKQQELQLKGAELASYDEIEKGRIMADVMQARMQPQQPNY